MINIERVKNIILNPKTEWDVIKTEEATLGNILVSYVIPLALIPSLAGLIGYSLIGKSIPLIGSFHSFSWGMSVSISTFLGAVIGVSLSSVIIDALAPSFGSEKNLNKTAQLVAYAYTPAWIAGILNIIPALSAIGLLAGLYGLYIMYLGLGPLKNTPEDKKVPYIIVSILLIVVLSVVIGIILASILGLFGLGMTAGYSNVPTL
jgi:hypothetical protein